MTLAELEAARWEWRMPAVVERIIDGDTIEMSIMVMPGMELNHEHVRVEGINAPEMGTTAGRDATIFAQGLLPIGMLVTLIMNHRDKYGRVLARIQLPDGRDFSALMLDANQAVVYNG